jgi:hypothetical protein
MPTDPTPERVREWAAMEDHRVRFLYGPADEQILATENERNALAREVIALREIAEEAANAWHAAQHGMENGPCLCPSHKVARARLDALGGG